MPKPGETAAHVSPEKRNRAQNEAQTEQLEKKIRNLGRLIKLIQNPVKYPKTLKIAAKQI